MPHHDRSPRRLPDVPRSPTGRVPQWVLDEATGRPATPAPWRAGPPVLGPPPRRARRWRAVGVVLVLAAVTAGVAWVDGSLLPATQQRVAVATGRATAPTPGFEARAEPIGAPAPVTVTSPSHRWVAEQEDGSPVAYDPCRPVHVAVRPDRAPTGADALLAAALADVSAATGLRLVLDPPTDEGPTQWREAYQPERYGDRWAPVLVAWVTPSEVPDFAAGLAGEAGSQAVWSAATSRMVYVTGVVHLDPVSIGRLLADPASAGEARAVVDHELGHLVGLAHVNDPAQLLHPGTKDVERYGPGDLTGLAELGRGACAPDL
ncbi:hypothetical protein GCM10027047_17440 [Rhodococcus aerolatus]